MVLNVRMYIFVYLSGQRVPWTWSTSVTWHNWMLTKQKRNSCKGKYVQSIALSTSIGSKYVLVMRIIGLVCPSRYVLTTDIYTDFCFPLVCCIVVHMYSTCLLYCCTYVFHLFVVLLLVHTYLQLASQSDEPVP